MSDRRGPEDAWSEFVLAVFDVNGLITQAGERISRPLGQSSARWHVLGRAFQPQTVAQMAAEMGHARQSVQRVADVLEREGLIAYRPLPTDRRTKLVELTPRGHEVLGEIYQRQVAWFAEIASRLSEATLRELTTSLNEVSQALASSMSNEEQAS
ncbi:MarR family winged helix-turn-helix transcriptional regulator [Sphaerisporangium perillae]|uniref:MarR family winged helix-turn-helix transcriptional regulator n=1 Tax=Sphaerisporangium perillae TaxID=2935860 RepID=UPI00200F205E|nr:MarR family transcriptional regulator [Sphaerisporangium perillae]